MPNILDADGLQTATRAELIAQFTAGMQTLYGSDINLASDSPDGQWMNIIVQAALDEEDLITQTYTSMDPDQAIGVVLDQRVTWNGIQRLAGTFTIQDVTIVTNQGCQLIGLDTADDSNPVYTVADQAGYQWFLQSTITIAGAGTQSLAFQASTPGANSSDVNTITVPISIVLGVVSVNNPLIYTTLGVNEETDAALRLRRQQSVSQASQGYYLGLLAALLNVVGVTSAQIYENDTDTTDGDGTPGHTIWVVVQGSFAPLDVAEAIYRKRNAGAGMRGDQTYVITSIGTPPITVPPFTVRWDDVTSEALFIKFTVTSLDGINPPNTALIRTTLPTLLTPGVNEQVNINDLATLVQSIDSNTLVTNAGFSLSHGGSYTNTLSPSSKTKFFVVTAPNIDILPVQISPSAATVTVLGTQQFTGVGGFGAYTFSAVAMPSGGNVSSGGLYTAGSTPNVTDIIQVSDADANTTTANISVVP